MRIYYRYWLVFIISLILLSITFFIENNPLPLKGEYYWSHLIRDCLTQYVRILLTLLAFIACYQFKLNPWITAFCVFAIFPIVSFIEGTIYKGSHNLIPFELITFFLWSLPTVAAGYLGKWLQHKNVQSNNI